ncbi:MAG TPA: sulfatase-like hydrolase/transferase [Terriglobia bacterium]|nr:sulfatase-like hydrolase/transferase [Terriglobia bacterium]
MALTGAVVGFLVGILEAALLYFIPRATGLIRPDVVYAIWFIAPLVDLLTGALLGLVLGLACSARKTPALAAVVAAIGLGLIGAFVAWLLDWFRIGVGIVFPRRLEITTPIVCFLIVFAISLTLIAFLWRRAGRFFRTGQPLSLGRWPVAVLGVAIFLGCGIGFYALHRPDSYPARSSSVGAPPEHPNIVLIVLDTVRADHLSCYGYKRPTTPHLDSLAARGVRFENAIAPSSWTLPSIASIFTGLLPHQHGANWGTPLPPEPWTLARILQSKGYETAGFNANPFYGLAGWRLDEGFDAYLDASYTLRHNLAVTQVGQSALRFLYNRLIRYNRFDHLTAADLNNEVMEWYRRRDRSQPYFLFINYMDAHRPYLPPASYDHRFGKIPHYLLARVSETLKDGRPRHAYTERERQELIDGYDNSLAYLDDQLGRLIDSLRSEPGGGNTIFIVTSDHGEGFGEHGTYDHGWNLYSEVLRVPLILSGPGIPAGTRVSDVVPNRRLFATVLDLALGLKGPISQASLRQYWTEGFKPEPAESEAVSELVVYSSGSDPASLSLSTPRWHLIQNSDGSAELFDRHSDREEKTNLAARPGIEDTVHNLKTGLESRIAYSLLPWRSLASLSPLDKPGATFIQQISKQPFSISGAGLPIGSAQAVFSHQRPSLLPKPNPAEQDILRSLPYH